MRKELGKISKVTFGKGGYQECQFGLFIHFEFKGSGCFTSVESGWDAESIKHSDNCKWSEQDRANGHDELCRKVSKILKDAKVDSVHELEGKPIEAQFDEVGFGTLKDWRILTEVL